jgi:uncharacterized membrane protein YeaQ/YmgE (transglycosylase-associated protein family)
MLWEIIAWIVIGGLAGWIASMIMGTNASMGPIANIVVGIVGAVIGGFLAGLLGLAPDDANAFNLWSLIIAILGAVVLLFLIGLVQRST